MGIGTTLIEAMFTRAKNATPYTALALTTFRVPRWNGPWFRGFGFAPMPQPKIGPDLRAILDRQSGYLDPATRETLWLPLPTHGVTSPKIG